MRATILLHVFNRAHWGAEANDAIETDWVFVRKGVEGEKVAFLSLEVKADRSRPLFHIVEDVRHILFTPHHVDVIHV